MRLLIVFGILVVVSIIGIILSRIFWIEEWSEWVLLISVIILVISIIFGGAILACRLEAKREIQAFEETRNMIEMVIDESSETENFGITQTIIERNMWLVEANASVKKYVCSYIL